MKKLLREPLLHFLLIGFGLFVVYGFANENDESELDRQIVVSPGRIEQLANIFEKTWQRPPTDEELKATIDDFVLEEIYYRQAVVMGIDRDDTIIRRRLRQKMEFLTDDAASFVEPTEEELASYLAENEDRFRESSTYTFRQIYFNPEEHGDNPEDYVVGRIDDLRSGKVVTGDSGLLPESFDQATRQVVDGTFGIDFSRKLDELTNGSWQGPVRSGFGLHLIHLEARTEGRLPELDKIRPIVQREWANQKRIATRQNVNDRLLEEYEVVIEWPEENNVNESFDEGESS